ncbi:hypothetical protein NNC19_05700 [Clostridium sp. SHJSY1]|uniref:FIST signal transduction protein n=1 Tax=Clostridium sp. SHJSY1 TaxID=2942483 RepID=UPI00287550D1|nr:FIST N-terminal domain-containing protein [Clostridium sp. SHJSY1]MDS0525169.1 hypothetical protein [Clostridium sp. SHJSY1]
MKDYIGIGESHDIQTAVQEATNGLSNPKAIFIFSKASKFKEVVSLINQKYPNTIVIGTTGYSFANRSVVRDNVVIWAITGGVEIGVGVLENAKTAPVKYIKTLQNRIQRINPGEDNTICLEFCTSGEEKIVSTISSAINMKNIPLIGGTAQGVDRDGGKYVSLNGKLYTDACVYALIKNTEGKVKVYSENIYKEKSKNYIATKVDVENRKIIELNGRNAAEVYCEALGISKDEITDCVIENQWSYRGNSRVLVQGVSNGALANPLARVIGKEEFLAAIKSVDEKGALSCYKRINQNDVLNILELRDYRDVVYDTLRNIRRDFPKISGVFSINCIYRFSLFENIKFTEEYVDLMSSVGRHVGIVSEGEQYINQHVNQTMVCAVFE